MLAINNNINPLIEQYLSYLSVMKGRSDNTIDEYRNDLNMFFRFIKETRYPGTENINVSDIDIDFIKSISIHEMYYFIGGSFTGKKLSPSTRARRIVSIRQFWKYLKTKAHLIDNNITEELETPKVPKRIPKYLNLEDSIRLLIKCEDSVRNHCILTIFLNCALRLSELSNINIDQITGETLRVIGKGNKERIIFLTPATKKSISDWLEIRKTMKPVCNALFITKSGTRLTKRAIQDMVKKHIEDAGLDSKKISTHKLRHTAAILMYKYGKVDIRSLQQILGHESIATTEIYTHLDENQLQYAVNSNPLATMFNT
jgi:Site-specific recombinase XerD